MELDLITKEEMKEVMSELLKPLVEKMNVRVISRNEESGDGEKLMSKSSIMEFLDVSATWVELKEKEGKLTKLYLDGKKSIRYKKAEVLNLVKTYPDLKETRKPKVTGKGRKKSRGMNKAA